MTETMTSTRSQGGATIRGYRPSDHQDCRRLWGELVRHRGGLYGDAVPDGDPGAGFEEYLTQLNLSGLWVADSPDGVIGLIGLMLDGRNGEIDPVVVDPDERGHGIGPALLRHVVEEARRRGLRRLTISPSVRDHAALHSLHTAGFGTVATVTLAYDLGGARPSAAPDGLDLYDLHFAV